MFEQYCVQIIHGLRMNDFSVLHYSDNVCVVELLTTHRISPASGLMLCRNNSPESIGTGESQNLVAEF